MIFTWTGHISKRLAGSPKGSEVESHSSLTSYSHCLVCVCNVRLRTACRSLLASSSLMEKEVLRRCWRKQTKKCFEWSGLLLTSWKSVWTDQERVRCAAETEKKNTKTHRQTQGWHCCYWVNIVIPFCNKSSFCSNADCFTFKTFRFPLFSVSQCVLLVIGFYFLNRSRPVVHT